MFSQALDSANFDDSFNNRTFTEDSLEVIDTTHNETNTTQNDTSITTEETDSGQNMNFTLLKAEMDDLKQQLEQVRELFNSENSIQVIAGTI